MDKVWILTRAINEYNQDGEYFEEVFFSLPSKEEISLSTGMDFSTYEHILNGGGRIGYEYEWWYLRCYEK